jgi:hypothetical protein
MLSRTQSAPMAGRVSGRIDWATMLPERRRQQCDNIPINYGSLITHTCMQVPASLSGLEVLHRDTCFELVSSSAKT